MRITDAEEGKIVFKTDGVVGRRIYEHPEAQANIITMEPGAVIPKHSVTVKTFIFVLEGAATVVTDESSAELSADQLLECPADLQRQVENNTSGRLRIMVVKSPAD